MEHIRFNQFSAEQATQLEFAVIVPVLNERGNIAPLLNDMEIALAGIRWEAVFVDDGSTDGTIDVIQKLALLDQSVRLVRRIGRRGLSSAVVEGFLSTVAPVVAVIDGDRQHDATRLPLLYNAISTDGCELAVGTRYADGGSVGEWAISRIRISKFATNIAQFVMKSKVSDPMSGFFAMRRDVFVDLVPRLSKTGYKILLDIVASSNRPMQIVEIPYKFNTRTAGESKLDILVIIEYGELLLDKIIGKYVPVKLLMFGAIGCVGAILHLFLLSQLMTFSTVGFATSQSLATFGAMMFNFTLNNRLLVVSRERR